MYRAFKIDSGRVWHVVHWTTTKKNNGHEAGARVDVDAFVNKPHVSLCGKSGVPTKTINQDGTCEACLKYDRPLRFRREARDVLAQMRQGMNHRDTAHRRSLNSAKQELIKGDFARSDAGFLVMTPRGALLAKEYERATGVIPDKDGVLHKRYPLADYTLCRRNGIDDAWKDQPFGAYVKYVEDNLDAVITCITCFTLKT